MRDEHCQRKYEETSTENAVTPIAEDNPLSIQDVPVSNKPTFTAMPTTPHARPIEYRYLSFESDIPLTPVIPPELKNAMPPCPNLRNYDDPFTWSKTRKNLMTYLSCSVNITAAYAAGSYESPAFQLTKKWGVSDVAYNVGISIFTYGFGVAPMVLAPFSEINGRRPLFIVTGVLFVICQMCCALTESYGGMLAARFFLGVGGSTFSTMVGGILADVWLTADRNTPMVLFTGATMLGTGLGPLVSGFVAQNLSWRWVFWIQVITSGVLVSLVTIFFKETRGSIILSRKAKLLNKWYEKLEGAGALGMEVDGTGLEEDAKQCCRIRWRVKADEERSSIGRMIAVSLYRPIHMLFTEPVVFFFSLWIGFSWAVLYLQFGSIPLVYEVNHGFSLEQTGAIFTSICVGGIISTILSIWQEKWAVKHYPVKINGSPEGRLIFTCVESALMPIGMFWFGWTCYPSIHWIVPTLGITVATMGIFSIYLATFNYTADVYHVYASSALAASGLCRNLMGGSFPLVTKQMFQRLGFQAASSLLGGIGAALTLVPLVLFLYGPKIRAKSKIASAFT
jgi:multidrug resistance protein